ncbi:MAG: GNAT family N-acetyltransferase [Anaerolineaceae bacterium]|nr:GNAT family N-acetyltransferase [Anaerolineaceae bacterium]
MPEQDKRMFTIQQASWRDLRALTKLEKECFYRDAWPLIELMGVLTFPGVVRLRAVGDDKFVGFIAGDPRKRENTGWILTLAVLPDWRRLGIAGALLNACEEQMHMPKVKLSVRRSNAAAIRLYEKLGYKQVDIWSKYYQGGEDGLVLEKEMAWI